MSIYSGRVRTRACALVVRDSKLLLVKQHVPTRNEPVWLAPGGEVEVGETAKSAAKRETLEETGLDIVPNRLVAIHEFVEPPFHAIELFFLSDIKGGKLKVGHDPEHAEDDQLIVDCRFVEFDELNTIGIISPGFIQTLFKEDLLRGSGKVIHVEHVAD